MKYVYILEVVEETDDEVSMKIDSVYTTREKAESMGKNLVAIENNGITYYSVTRYLIFQ